MRLDGLSQQWRRPHFRQIWTDLWTIFERIRSFVCIENVLDLWFQVLKNGSKNTSVTFIFLFSVSLQGRCFCFLLQGKSRFGSIISPFDDEVSLCEACTICAVWWKHYTGMTDECLKSRFSSRSLFIQWENATLPTRFGAWQIVSRSIQQKHDQILV